MKKPPAKYTPDFQTPATNTTEGYDPEIYDNLGSFNVPDLQFIPDVPDSECDLRLNNIYNYGYIP